MLSGQSSKNRIEIRRIVCLQGLQSETVFELLIRFLESRSLFFLEIVDIFVGLKSISRELDHGDGDVGTVIGHPFTIGHDVVEHKALGDGADSVLEAVLSCSRNWDLTTR